MPGVSVKDVNSHMFVKAYADFLKKSGKIEVPVWADVVKTNCSKELAPYDSDWFYTRCAAVARKVYIRSHLGIGALKTMFGAKKRRGSRPSHFSKGSGSICRAALQQLQKINVLGMHEDGGRVLTSEGRQDLDRIAKKIYENQVK